METGLRFLRRSERVSVLRAEGNVETGNHVSKDANAITTLENLILKVLIFTKTSNTSQNVLFSSITLS